MSPETRDARVLKSKNASSYHLDASSMHLNTTEKEKLFKASMNENSLFVLERMPRLLPGFSATIMKTNENGATRLCLTLKQQSYQMYSQVRHSRGSRKRRCFHTKAKLKAESCWEQRGDSAGSRGVTPQLRARSALFEGLSSAPSTHVGPRAQTETPAPNDLIPFS